MKVLSSKTMSLATSRRLPRFSPITPFDFGAADQGVTGPLDLRFVFNLTGSQLGDGFAVSYTVDLGGGNSSRLNVPGAVPEPAIPALLLCGIAALIFLRHKVRSARV